MPSLLGARESKALKSFLLRFFRLPSSSLSNTDTKPNMVSDLADFVRVLPPKLINKIRDLVFNINLVNDTPSPHHITVDQKYRFPKQLHINRAHRKQYGQRHFGSAIFIFPSWNSFHRFIDTLVDEHLKGIKQYRIKETGREYYQMALALSQLECRAKKLGMDIPLISSKET